MLTTPSPHSGRVQSGSHVDVKTLLPGSHASPGSMMPLPQLSFDWHFALQPSPLTLLLSSQVSPVAISKTPLPHVSSLRQSALQPSPPRLLPSSQRSPTATSTTPLPHV